MRSLLVLILLTTPAVADSKAKSAEAMHADDCAKARKANKTCVLTIEDEKVTGSTPTANGIGVAVIGAVQHASLVKPRQDFIVEILKSADDL
jgi:hypothetical protein